MFRILYIVILLLIPAASLAQQLPERSLVRKGNRSYAKGDYAQSIERYQEALEVAQDNFEAQFNLGNALFRAEQYDKAVQVIGRAAADTLRTDAERAEAFYNLGNTLFAQQKFKEALESYKQSLRLHPADEQTKYNYAYTKRLLDNQQDQDQQDQNQDQQDQDQDQQDQNQDQQDQDQDQQDQNQNQNQDQQDQNQNQDQQDQNQQNNPEDQSRDAQQQSANSAQEISQQEQERMLEAIQAQEDRTQEKLKEREGVVVQSRKNW